MNVGLDVGRGYVKAINCDKTVKYESYSGPFRELDYYNDDDKYIVSINDKKYFVGDIAKREGLGRGFQKQKVDKMRTLPLSLTALYLITDKLDVDVNLVCGVPIFDFNSQKNTVESFLKGSYEVQIGNGLKKNININNVKVFPEGAGAYFSLILNNEGKAVESELSKVKVGIIDIGYKTTNVVVFENLKYVDRLSTSFNLGVHQAFNMIYKRLSRYDDITMDQAENITEGEEFRQLADRIKNEVNKFWGNTSFKIYLCGGGAYLLRKYFEEFDVIKGSEFANANGYFKISQMIYNPEKLVWKI